MFQFRRFPSQRYGFTLGCLDMTPDGLLHSDIHGSMPTYGSPWLFAVSRVLLRLPVPRHSPCALCSLTMCSWFFFLPAYPELSGHTVLEIVDFLKSSQHFTAGLLLALSASFLYSVFNVHQLRWTVSRLRINPRSAFPLELFSLPGVFAPPCPPRVSVAYSA